VTYVLVAVFGAAGAVSRYALDGWISDATHGQFPWEGEGKLLRIFIGESDKHGRKPLYQAIVEMLREEGMAGATVLRGIEGFGANSHLHTARILRLSEDLPVVIEVADTEERIEAVIPRLDEMVTDGMVTLEKVEVVTYRAQEKND
jgi:PII-like signaling protein